MPSRVLVVDDENEQRRVFRRLLESRDLAVSCAGSAAEALDMLAGTAPLPHLILSDIAMPGMDGVAFVKRLRARAETAAIPAILMSGLPLPAGLLAAAAEALAIGPIHLKGAPFEGLLAQIDAKLEPAKDARRVVIDPLKRAVWIGGDRLPPLPPRRYQLLCALLGEERAMTREELLAQAWDGNDNPNVVDVTILRLRLDLKALPFLRIETTPAGYRLTIDRASRSPRKDRPPSLQPVIDFSRARR